MPEVPGVWMEHDVTLNFRDYKTASRYAAEINAGYSARLNDLPKVAAPEDSTGKTQAWLHGWDMADVSMREVAP